MNFSYASTLWIAAGLGAGVALAQLNVGGAASTPPAPLASLQQASEQADLVFEGVVQGLEYRSSQVLEAGDRPLPFTYVTFRVDRVFQGQIDTRGRTGLLTLRFLGGPLEGPAGPQGPEAPWLKASHGVEFELGDRELLQVKNHGSWGVPLVQGPLRRLSIEGQRVFDEGGRQLAAVVEASPEQLADDGSYAPQPGAPMGAPELRYWLSETLAPTAGATVRSAFPDDPFSVPGPRPAAAQLAPTVPQPPVHGYAFNLWPSERLEHALFERNLQNPVLR